MSKEEAVLSFIACLVGLGFMALLRWAGMSDDEIFRLVVFKGLF